MRQAAGVFHQHRLSRRDPTCIICSFVVNDLLQAKLISLIFSIVNKPSRRMWAFSSKLISTTIGYAAPWDLVAKMHGEPGISFVADNNNRNKVFNYTTFHHYPEIPPSPSHHPTLPIYIVDNVKHWRALRGLEVMRNEWRKLETHISCGNWTKNYILLDVVAYYITKMRKPFMRRYNASWVYNFQGWRK